MPGWLLLLWAWSLPCDAACYARAAEPTPIWLMVVVFMYAVAATNVQLVLIGALKVRQWWQS